MIRLPRILTAPVLPVALCLLAIAFGCAPKQVAPPLTGSPDEVWQAFRQQYCNPVTAPGLKLKASLRYTREKPEKRSDRTVLSIWGDFGGPMRLDVSATFGKIVTMIREDSEGLLVFYPTEEKAYAHSNPVLGATSLGIPFPFSLNELAHVSMGDYSGLAAESYSEVKQNGNAYVFTLKNALATSITLDGMGRPIIIEGRGATAYDSTRQWRLSMDKFGNEPAPQPAKLILSLDNGEQGVLRIKSRELKKERWPVKSTDLTLPDDTEFFWLDGRAVPTG